MQYNSITTFDITAKKTTHSSSLAAGVTPLALVRKERLPCCVQLIVGNVPVLKPQCTLDAAAALAGPRATVVREFEPALLKEPHDVVLLLRSAQQGNLLFGKRPIQEC